MVNMGIFHRSSSSSSRNSSTFSAASDGTSPRTSTDSCAGQQEVERMEHKATATQKAPILGLPVELIRHVTSYLNDESSAAFCLSSRYIYYALGSDCLTSYINTSKSRFAKRRMIEAIVERAFPGHWFCAWCDVFHSWSASTGPTNTHEIVKKRDCIDYNSYLHAGPEYTLRFHHIRLAVNRFFYGAGIPLSSFTHTRAAMANIYRTPVPTNLSISAKIVTDHVFLHTSLAIILPAWSTSRKHILDQIWPILPHILSGHRASPHGHTGLMAAVDNVVRRGWIYPSTQTCSSCATDWAVNAHFFPHATGGQMRLVVQCWRDLGHGRSPFESGWRAHGVCVRQGSGGDGVRVGGVQAGDVRRGFERGRSACEGLRGKRTGSQGRASIYHGFMREEGGERGEEVMRSRARRPNVWRTASENEEVERREDEDRIEAARQIAESLVRLDVERGAYEL